METGLVSHGITEYQLIIAGFSQEECESQKNIMTAKLSALEEQAYTLAGHPFSLSATEDIAQVYMILTKFSFR